VVSAVERLGAARAIRLDGRDNVAVCCRAVEAGERVLVDGGFVIAREAVALGHKLALVALAAGDRVLKYGMPIGSMTAAAAAGEWVHLHNMKSDYLPAQGLGAAGEGA